MSEFYIITSPDGKKFLQEGTGNSELDGDIVVDELNCATFFDHDPSSKFMQSKLVKGKWVTSDKRRPENYWHSKPVTREDRQLGRFMQTCVVKKVKMEVMEEA